ncbi:MAG: RNA methyltransferase [Zetaproteobacteria bacterium]|nr:MAG: RNA methyltransferase [Zetaproteobacteria bacterium]
MTENIYKYPRLYINVPFSQNIEISLDVSHVHYLKNVLRKNVNDVLRVFNGHDGEWLASINMLAKKDGSAILTKQIKQQRAISAPVALFFSPIKKQRMDFLIEKAVELGVDDLYPILMNRTENRKLNEDRMRAQIIEAAEQCERLDVPILHPVQKLSDLMRIGHDLFQKRPLLVCLERNEDSIALSSCLYEEGANFLIGPEGGFDVQEVAALKGAENMVFVDLGRTILRAETAAIVCLSYARMSGSS